MRLCCFFFLKRRKERAPSHVHELHARNDINTHALLKVDTLLRLVSSHTFHSKRQNSWPPLTDLRNIITSNFTHLSLRGNTMIVCRASHLNPEPLSYRLTLQRCTSLPPKPFTCTVSASLYRPRWNSASYVANPSNGGKSKTFEVVSKGLDGEGDRKVHCEVEVISWRERKIKAEILVNADIESVWNALTDYERLADFIPNLVCR